jgi:arginase
MDVLLLLVPYDSAHRGLRLGAGPERLIECELAQSLERAGHQVRTTTVDPPADRWRAEVGTAFQLAAVVASHVRDARQGGTFPVILAGNCLSTLGVIAGLGPGIGLLWFDAHGDFNTPETTLGGFLDGMALATITGRCWSAIAAQVPGFHPVAESNVWLLGTRDLDPLEAQVLTSSAVRRIGVDAIDRSLGYLVRRDLPGPAGLHVHLDLDVMDPRDGRANEYAAPDGVRSDALVAACRSLGATVNPVSLTISAYDPTFDTDGRVARTAIDAAVALLDGVASRSKPNA